MTALPEQRLPTPPAANYERRDRPRSTEPSFVDHLLALPQDGESFERSREIESRPDLPGDGVTTDKMIKEFDPVVLTEDLPADGLKAGDVGWVVMVHDDGAGFEVEFATLAGETVSVVTVPSSAVRPVGPKEIAHARLVA